MIRSITKTLGLLYLFCIAITPAFADGKITSWKVSELARTASENIEIRDNNNRLIKTLSAKQMLYLHATMLAIIEASEVHAEFVIVPGKFPNAFASSTRDSQGFIAINFAMLDLLGNNADMAAALIGHELAHLKLAHGAEQRENRQRNTGSVFSASNTRYSRDNEREADYLGTIWAIEAGYNPQGSVTLQEAIYRSSRSGGANITHPSSIERITVLKSLVRRLSKN